MCNGLGLRFTTTTNTCHANRLITFYPPPPTIYFSLASSHPGFPCPPHAPHQSSSNASPPSPPFHGHLLARASLPPPPSLAHSLPPASSELAVAGQTQGTETTGVAHPPPPQSTACISSGALVSVLACRPPSPAPTVQSPLATPSTHPTALSTAASGVRLYAVDTALARVSASISCSPSTWICTPCSIANSLPPCLQSWTVVSLATPCPLLARRAIRPSAPIPTAICVSGCTRSLRRHMPL